MSCHDVGRAVNAIMKQVLEMYDAGKLSKEAALEMVAKFPKAVYWCDGNEYEAQVELTKTHCACCLKKYESDADAVFDTVADHVLNKEDILNPENISSWSYSWWYEVLKKHGFNGWSVCRECFVKYFAEVLTPEGMKKVLNAPSEHSEWLDSFQFFK